MEAIIKNARALGPVGEYDFTGEKGEKYRYIDLFNEAAGEVVRLSLAKDCTPPADLAFGSQLDVLVVVRNNEKIVRGEDRDRSMKSLKLSVTGITAAAKAQPVRQAA